MKILVTTPFIASDGTHDPAEILDVEQSVAENWIANGLATTAPDQAEENE